MRERESYREIILENIDYDILTQDEKLDRDRLDELVELMVDNGCTVLDVIVEHPVYGQLTGQLQISSRYDVEQFLARVQAHDAAPLSMLTGGIHLHTLRCPDAAACERACAALKAAGLLLDD